MARAEKAAAVAEIVDSFNDSAGAVLTEYRGLTVKQLQDLRRSLRGNANYAVVKNTLAKLAANEAGIEAKSIGTIEISEKFSLVELPEDLADVVIQALRATTIKGKRQTVRRDAANRRGS